MMVSDRTRTNTVANWWNASLKNRSCKSWLLNHEEHYQASVFPSFCLFAALQVTFMDSDNQTRLCTDWSVWLCALCRECQSKATFWLCFIILTPAVDLWQKHSAALRNLGASSQASELQRENTAWWLTEWREFLSYGSKLSETSGVAPRWS